MMVRRECIIFYLKNKKNCNLLYNYMCEFDFVYNDFYFFEECMREMENVEYLCIDIERG